jgi:hypothetical protein
MLPGFAVAGYAQATSEIAEKQPPWRRKRLSKTTWQKMTERKQAKAIRESIVLLYIGIRAQNMGFLCVSVPISDLAISICQQLRGRRPIMVLCGW